MTSAARADAALRSPFSFSSAAMRSSIVGSGFTYEKSHPCGWLESTKAPRWGLYRVVVPFLMFAYMPRPSLTMASATMEPVCRTTSSVVDPTVLARVFLTLSQTFGSLRESR